MKLHSILSVSLAAAMLAGQLLLPTSSLASGGATDPIPGTSKSGLSAGGGTTTTTSSGGVKAGGGKATTAPIVAPRAPAPAPAPTPIISGTLTFTAAASVNGVVPVCAGSYHIDPYYPTLSLMTMDVQASSVNVPDGTPLYVTINLAGGSGYPGINTIVLAGQAGVITINEYVTIGTTVQSVVVSDASGAIVSAGN